MCKSGVVEATNERPSTLTTPSTEATIDTIGLDIAKNSLSVHRLAVTELPCLTYGVQSSAFYSISKVYQNAFRVSAEFSIFKIPTL